MKILFISDLHGNYPALETVWKKESDSDVILCAGDIIDYGFHPKEVVEWCREHQVISVSGNHDRALCKAYDEWKMGSDRYEKTMMGYTLSKLSEEDVNWIRQLKMTETFQANDLAVFMKHYCGDNEADRKAILQRWARDEAMDSFLDEWPKDLDAKTKVVFTGHSHQCILFQVGEGCFFLNPGSISYRVKTDSRVKGAFYAVYENGHFELRHASYDQKMFIPIFESIPLTENERRMTGYNMIYTLPEGEMC